MRTFPAADYLDFAHTAHAALFAGAKQMWDPLAAIGAYLQSELRPENHGRVVGDPFIGPAVYIGEGTVIEPGAMITGPAWIGKNCQIRHGAYLRENVIVGDDAVLGNSCEFKNCLLFDGVQVPHFNYVGDSILGHKAHLGAGVILSNVRLDHLEVEVTCEDGQRLGSGLRKFGAVLGDFAEIGCNAVLNPGSVIGRHSLVYPCSAWTGVLPHFHIARARATFQLIERKEKK